MLYGLNPSQKKAVETVQGRLLLLAGAGSGKTRVLTARMAYLIKHLGIPAQHILGLTFTNKAADEMRHRLLKWVEPKVAKQVTLVTFHSLCMQILKEEIFRLGYTSKFTLYDEQDVLRVVKTIARDLLEHEGPMPSLNSTIEIIAMARAQGIKAEEIQNTGSKWHDEFSQNLYKRLQDSMRAYNAVDFDSLLSLTVELFEKHPEVLLKYQEKFRYVMIDEYQDTNPIQYKLATLISAKYNNLCVVGDDDQSIYGWRGASVDHILEFDKAHPSGAIVIKLEQNYRSTETILKAANAVIANNTKRHGKALWSANGIGDPIEVFYAPKESDEAQAVIYRIDQLRKIHNLKWKDMAILYRSNALSNPFEMALLKYSWQGNDGYVRGIPYHIHGGCEFFERKEIKDLMGYLRVIVNPLDQEALLRIINYPRRGIGDASLDLITSFNRSNHLSLWEVLCGLKSADSKYTSIREQISPKALQGIESFIDTIEKAKQKFVYPNLSSSMKWLIETINYQKAIIEEVKSEQMRNFKKENIEALVNALATYETDERNESIKSLDDYVISSPLDSTHFEKGKKSQEDDSVSLMTFHSAKGLEFSACFLVGLEDHIIPHEKSLKQTGVEEERRLMYVALTRAMKYATLSMATKRMKMGVEIICKPSRFLFEIPKELLKVTSWGLV